MTVQSTAQVPITAIEPPAFMLRDPPTPGEVKELAESIRAHGLLEPLVVRPKEGKFELIAGHRRFLAVRYLKQESVMCIVNDVDDATAIIIGISENIDRKDASPLRMAQAIKQLVDKQHMTTATIGKKLGKTPEWTSRMIRLADKTKFFSEAFQTPHFTLSHALELLPLRSEAKLEEAIDIVIDKRLSFRETRKLVTAMMNRPLKKTPTSAEEKGDEGYHGLPMTCGVCGKQKLPGEAIKVVLCKADFDRLLKPHMKAKDEPKEEKGSDKE